MTFAVIVLTINATAQHKQFQFGLKIAPEIDWIQLNSDELYGSDTKFSFNWGFFGSMYFVENYGITSGFNVFSMKGDYSYKINEDPANAVVTKIDVKYIEIPLTLTMRTDQIGKMRIFGKIGYGFGVLTSEKNKIEYKGTSDVKLESPDFHNIRNSLIIGLGVEYNVFKSSCLTAAVVFNDNLTNVIKTNDVIKHDIKLNTIYLEVGFLF